MSKIKTVYAIEIDCYHLENGVPEYLETVISQEAYADLETAKKYINDRCETVAMNGWRGIQNDGPRQMIYRIRELEVKGGK